MKKHVAFIIQARLTSTRLPNKILLPFWEDKTLLDLLVSKLKQFNECSIILATSDEPTNQPLVDFAKRKNLICFQGSENDVLYRFIEAAERNNIEHIVRICSDNPFLDIHAIEELLRQINESNDYDYISFLVNGLPSIKTHFGFWTEYVTLKALHKVSSLSNEMLYHEHVTNYIYTHPEYFKIGWMSVPDCIKNRHDIRLTIDTLNDFKIAQKIYSDLHTIEDLTIDDIVKYIDTHPELSSIMQQEITTNSK